MARPSQRSAPSSRPPTVPLMGFTLLAVIMVGARSMIPSRAPVDPDLVPILVGTRSNTELVHKVRSQVPAEVGSTVNSATWTDTGLLVSVSTTGPRVVVLLDSQGGASVAHAQGETIVHLAVPCCDPEPPYTVTVVKPRGSGGVLDAKALQVASLK